MASERTVSILLSLPIRNQATMNYKIALSSFGPREFEVLSI